jgi:hypothetical protein
LNLVLDVAGPIAEMDAPTIAMFKRFQRALLTLAREWRDPDLEAKYQAQGGEPQTAGEATPQNETAVGSAA